MKTRRTTIGDVLGLPNTWPDFSFSGTSMQADMGGAWISEVVVTTDGLAISTRGAASGPTYSVFRIEDRDLKRRAARVLKTGMNVDAVCVLAI
jgi:hypothetical protein